jgi:hypothetical protein
MAFYVEPANRPKSRLSPKTETCRVELPSVTRNVVEKFVGAQLDGSDSSISAARVNGDATVDVITRMLVRG